MVRLLLLYLIVMATLLQIVSGLLAGNQKIISPLPGGKVGDFTSLNSSQTPDIKSKVLDFYKSKMPKSLQNTSLTDYYPALHNIDDILAKEQLRPGAGILGALQAFYESTGGRKTKNLFGVKPGGTAKEFATNKDAIDYQYGSKVLGGGSGGSLNILNKKTPLNSDEIAKFYGAYNPGSPYLNSLLNDFNTIYNK